MKTNDKFEEIKKHILLGYNEKEVAKKFNLSVSMIQKYKQKIGIIKEKPFHYREENFKNLVKEAKSIKDFFKKIFVNSKSNGNYNTFKKYATLYNVDYTHFKIEKKPNIQKLQKKSLEEILIKNLYYNSGSLKKKLYDNNLKSRRCEKCGQGEIWMGQKISLILDHVNGDNTDNRLENLRILCPNCNAATETFCRGMRKKREESKCSCGKIIAYDSTLCVKCSTKKVGLKRRKIINSDLYKEIIKSVEEFGYVKTGKKYGVSDNGVRNWIKRYENYHKI